MTDREDQQAMDVVERAAAALRDVRIPPGPPPAIVASTVEALQALDNPPDVVRHNARREIMFRIGRYSGIVAAASLLVVAGWFWFSGNGSGIAFADMIEKVKKAESVGFTVEHKVGAQPLVMFKVYRHGEHLRMEAVEMLDGAKGLKVLATYVGDMNQKQALVLDHARKTARRQEVADSELAEIAKFFASIRNAKQENAKLIGHDERDGRKLQVYQLSGVDFLNAEARAPGTGEEVKVWVDQKTGLPVRIQGESVLNSEQKERVVTALDQFVWDQVLDPKLFQLEVPEGYTAAEKLFSTRAVAEPDTKKD